MTGIIPIRRRSMCTFFLVLVLLLVEKQEYYTSFGKTGGASRSVHFVSVDAITCLPVKVKPHLSVNQSAVWFGCVSCVEM